MEANLVRLIDQMTLNLCLLSAMLTRMTIEAIEPKFFIFSLAFPALSNMGIKEIPTLQQNPMIQRTHYPVDIKCSSDLTVDVMHF